MAAYVLIGGADHIFDPAVGAGAFLRAAKDMAQTAGKRLRLLGTEIDPDALVQARANGLSDTDLSGIQLRDFALNPPQGPFQAIVANPPYIRHHRLSAETKAALKTFSTNLLGAAIDGRAGLHVYFLLRALQLLGTGGRLAFILPADTCEGVFASTLWQWITRRFHVQAVITFAPDASPFPGVDTNAVVFLIRNEMPRDTLLWARCQEAWTPDLQAWTASEFREPVSAALTICQRPLSEALSTGLSRPPDLDPRDGPVLGDYARVWRGIATGANDFFFLTSEQAATLQINDEFLMPAIGRTNDVSEAILTVETIAALCARGRPTLLFSPDKRPMHEFPPAVRDYLKQGEALGLPEKALISQRKPWYKMEVRRVPPFLFAYLGRRSVRFIKNEANIMPLTGFLCIYPTLTDPDFVGRLWKVLQHPETVANLSRVGKSYGNGAIKVEPRSLERLPLPEHLLEKAGLASPRLRFD